AIHHHRCGLPDHRKALSGPAAAQPRPDLGLSSPAGIVSRPVVAVRLRQRPRRCPGKHVLAVDRTPARFLSHKMPMRKGTFLARRCWRRLTGGHLKMSQPAGDRLFLGHSELARLMAGLDWDATPIGPPQRWPHSLRTAVRIMLTSQQPIWIGWGRDLAYLYNDPYKSIIGGKHPWALG